MSSHPVSFTIADVVASVGPDFNFKEALPFTLDHEGMVLEQVPGDPGGETCCGITHEDFAAFVHEHHQPSRSLGTATAADIGAVYKEHYWQPCQCAKMPFVVALTVFDSAVLVGRTRPIRWLQIELGVTVDGAVGPHTLGALGVYVQNNGAKQLADAVISQRRSFHQAVVASRPALHKFLNGWLNRVNDLQNAVDNA